MIFEFMAHRPHAYLWFALSLIMVVILNAVLIQSLHTILLNWNDWIKQSVVLIVPWMLLLFFPSVIIGLIIYYSLGKRVRFSLEETNFTITLINSRNKETGSTQIFKWEELLSFRFSDFEDNQYFTLVFRDKENNLIVHRNSGDFESFFEELKKHLKSNDLNNHN
jgi:hypothetical protein